MSGLEVAGVVLGGLPLVISALEHYAEGIATAKRFWRYKTEMRSLILQVNTEKEIFVYTLELLLTGIVRIEHMNEFTSDPDGTVWHSTKSNKRLQDRLRGVYKVYIDNMNGMETVLKKIMEKLALGSDGKPQFTDPNTFKHEYKRLRFSITRSEYAEQLGQLKNYNQALSRLTGTIPEVGADEDGKKSFEHGAPTSMRFGVMREACTALW